MSKYPRLELVENGKYIVQLVFELGAKLRAKLGAKLEAKLGAKLGAKSGVKLGATQGAKLEAKFGAKSGVKLDNQLSDNFVQFYQLTKTYL